LPRRTSPMLPGVAASDAVAVVAMAGLLVLNAGP
jgi:hypothetical protein